MTTRPREANWRGSVRCWTLLLKGSIVMSLELGLRRNSRPLERPSTQVCKNITLKDDLARNESGSDDVIRIRDEIRELEAMP